MINGVQLAVYLSMKTLTYYIQRKTLRLIHVFCPLFANPKQYILANVAAHTKPFFWWTYIPKPPRILRKEYYGFRQTIRCRNAKLFKSGRLLIHSSIILPLNRIAIIFAHNGWRRGMSHHGLSHQSGKIWNARCSTISKPATLHSARWVEIPSEQCLANSG